MQSSGGWCWKSLQMPLALGQAVSRELCHGHCFPVSGKQIRTTQGLGSAQHEKASRTSSKPGSGWTTMKVWTGRALATQEALSHSLERERIWYFFRVCINSLKANTHYFPLFFLFSQVRKKFQDSASVLGVLFRVLRNQTGQTAGVQLCGGNSSHLIANVF